MGRYLPLLEGQATLMEVVVLFPENLRFRAEGLLLVLGEVLDGSLLFVEVAQVFIVV